MSGALPSGLVTFLFTDIEGSTRLFHRLGKDYEHVLDLHHQALRSVWESHGGAEVSTEGDSFLVAFGDAGDAVKAAADGQRALRAVDWPEGVQLKVRMGIHSGLAAPRGEEYVALAVHQAARVISTAHGGQIVVTQDTQFLLGATANVSLRPLGRFRVRDFDEPIRLYQVAGEGLETDFPALRAIPADRHNIVERSAPTIGRAEAIAELADRVRARRALTLTGPGGVGKSRLAGDLGIAIASSWDDGVWMVELANVSEPHLVAGAVADAVGAPVDPGNPRTEDILVYLEARKAVVILDNCEHLLDACGDLVRQIQTHCRHTAIVATSREPLRTPDEMVWPVPPLDVPEEDARAIESAMRSPAIQLFVDRAAEVRPGFVVDEGNAASVTAIVRHLDGLPLLIELAAAHLSAQSPAEILRGIEDSVRFLRSRDPRISERHRTVEGLLSWSYQLLNDEEKAVFRRLSIFISRFSPASAVGAAADEDLSPDTVRETLWSLVERSLVVADFASEDTRYLLLETMRSYGRRLLDEAGETERVVARAAESLLARVGPWLSADREWVAEVSLEVDNIRALIPLTPADMEQEAQQLACTIGTYHDARQSFREGIDELTRLAGGLTTSSPARVSMLTTLADLHLRVGETDRALELLELAEAVRAEQGGPEWDDVAIERTRGEVLRRSGDSEAAIELAQRTLEEALSDAGQARMYNLLCTASAALGDFDTAYQACRAELELNEKLGYDSYIAGAHGNLAEVAWRLGDVAAAAGHQLECLRLALAQGSPVLVAFSLIVAARVASSRDDWRAAVALNSLAESQLEDIGLVLYEDDRKQSEDLMETARSHLGDTEFEGAVEEGAEASLSDAVDLAEQVLTAAEHS